MPGMGGPNQNRNFIKNCQDWKSLALKSDGIVREVQLRLAPMTGGVENIGYSDERQFYQDLVAACVSAGVALSIGDGCPDEKLQFGIEAVKDARHLNPHIKSAVFIKPYADTKICERIDWAASIMEIGGIDIDSYNIVTMRNLVHLERKTPEQLSSIKRLLNARGIPFAIKGIFTEDDVETVRMVKPDIAYISNHGGRVETRTGSTACFLETYHTTLLKSAGSLWVDGGIRTATDMQTAAFFGASTVLLGRPFASALCRGGAKAVHDLVALFKVASGEIK